LNHGDELDQVPVPVRLEPQRQVAVDARSAGLPPQGDGGALVDQQDGVRVHAGEVVGQCVVLRVACQRLVTLTSLG